MRASVGAELGPVRISQRIGPPRLNNPRRAAGAPRACTIAHRSAGAKSRCPYIHEGERLSDITWSDLSAWLLGWALIGGIGLVIWALVAMGHVAWWLPWLTIVAVPTVPLLVKPTLRGLARGIVAGCDYMDRTAPTRGHIYRRAWRIIGGRHLTHVVRRVAKDSRPTVAWTGRGIVRAVVWTWRQVTLPRTTLALVVAILLSVPFPHAGWLLVVGPCLLALWPVVAVEASVRLGLRLWARRTATQAP